MIKPKFEVGDRVRILNDPRFIFENGMLVPGTVAEITDIVLMRDDYLYLLNGERFVYSENILELVAYANTKLNVVSEDTDIQFQILTALADIRNTISRLLSKCGYE